MGVDKMDDNTRLIRNMMEASQIAYDHILWFYILNAFDYVNVPNALTANPTTPSLKAVQDQLKAFVASGQLGFLANQYWDNPGYKLPAGPGPRADGALPAVDRDAAGRQRRRRRVPRRQVPDDHELRRRAALRSSRGLDDVITYKQRMETVQGFVDTVVVPDLLADRPLLHRPRQRRQGRRQLPELGGPR